MFVLTCRMSNARTMLSNDFPKFEELKKFVTWQQYCALLEHRYADGYILTYQLDVAEVPWPTREVTEFHKITPISHVKIGFFSFSALMNVTRELTLYELASLMRNRFASSGDKQTIYVLE